MKEMIFRDLYLIRKGLLITAGIYAAVLICGLLAVMSAKYGNIAKYSYDSKLIQDVLRDSLYFAIIAGLMIVTAVEQAYTIIRKDYTTGWHQYQVASGIRSEMIVGVKYIIAFALLGCGLGLGILGLILMHYVSGVEAAAIIFKNLGKHEGMLILIYVSVVFLIVFDYFSLLEYIYKGKNSAKADLIMAAPVFVLIFASLFVSSVYEGDDSFRIKILEMIEKLQEHIGLLYTLPILSGAVATVICYFLSVRIVRREGKRV